MKPLPEQPEWFRRIAYQWESGRKAVVLFDGPSKAIVRTPGEMYASGQTRHYGRSSYYLLDKTLDFRRILRHAEMVHEGRAKKGDLERMRKLVGGGRYKYPGRVDSLG